MAGPKRSEHEVAPLQEHLPLPPVAMDIMRDHHVRRLHPRVWLDSARSLQYSAKIIFDHERTYAEILHKVAISELDRSDLTKWPTHSGAQLLYAFAFENLLKGIIIAKHPEIRDPGKWGCTEEQDKKLKKVRANDPQWMTHDIDQLTRLAGIDIPEPYRRLLWLFGGKAIWSGRYPTGVSVPSSVRYDSDGIPDLIQHPDPSDDSLASELFRILEAELMRLLPPD